MPLFMSRPRISRCDVFSQGIAHWPLYGNATDIIGGRNGTVIGGNYNLNDRFDNSTSAFRTFANNHYIQVANDSVWNLQQFTINSWIRWFDVETSTFPRIVDRGYSHITKIGWNTHISRSTGRVSIEIGTGSTNYQAIPPTSMRADRTWKMYTATFDGRFLKMYVNGGYPGAGITTTDTGGVTIVHNPTTLKFGFGNDGGTDQWSNQGINDVQIWDFPLEECQVNTLFRNQARNFLIPQGDIPRPFLYLGNSGYGTIGSGSLPSPLSAATSTRTVEATFSLDNYDVGDGYMVLYEEGAGSSGGNGLSIYVFNGRLYCGIWSSANGWGVGGSGATITRSVALTGRFIQHVAFVYDHPGPSPTTLNGSFIVYLNGQQAATATSGIGQLSGHGNGGAVGAINGSTMFHDVLEATPTGSSTFDGSVIEVRHWNIVRSQTDIANNIFTDYSGSPVHPNLIALWKFNEGSGTTVFDRTANANHLLLTGGYSWIT